MRRKTKIAVWLVGFAINFIFFGALFAVFGFAGVVVLDYWGDVLFPIGIAASGAALIVVSALYLVLNLLFGNAWRAISYVQHALAEILSGSQAAVTVFSRSFGAGTVNFFRRPARLHSFVYTSRRQNRAREQGGRRNV